MKKAIVVGILLVLVFGSLAIARPVDYVTKKCVFYLQFDKISQLVDNVSNYARRLGLPWSSRQIKAMLSTRIFQRPGFVGISLNRPIGFFIYSDGVFKGKPSSFGVMLPITSRSAFVRYVLPVFRMLMGRSGGVYYRGRYAFIASDHMAKRAFLYGRKKRINLINGANINYYIDLTSFSPVINKVLQKVSRQFQTLGDSDKEVMNLVINMYSKMLAQINSFTFSAGLSGKGLELGFDMPFKKGSALSKVLAKERSKKIAALGIIPADSLAVLGANYQWMADRGAYDKYSKWICSFYKKGKNLYYVKKLLAAQRDQYTGDFAVAMNSTKGRGLGFVVANQMKPGARGLDKMQVLVDYINNLPELRRLSKSGIRMKAQFQKNFENYNGVAIHRLAITIKSDRDIKPNKRRVISFIKKLFNARIAYTGGYELVAMGTDSQSKIKELIGNAAGRKGAVFNRSRAYTRIRRSYGIEQKNTLFYGSFSHIFYEIMKLASRFDKKGDMKQAVAMIARMLPRLGDGGILGYTHLSGKGVKGRVLFSKEEFFTFFRIYLFIAAKEKSTPQHKYNR